MTEEGIRVMASHKERGHSTSFCCVKANCSFVSDSSLSSKIEPTTSRTDTVAIRNVILIFSPPSLPLSDR